MSLAIVHSRALDGIAAAAVSVEVHLANGLPSFTLVGLAETEVKESRERVRAALQNCGLTFPHNKKIIVNLAPAELPKEGGRFDLPIALGLLAASGQIDAGKLDGIECAGELSLAGELRPVRGALAMSLALRREASPRSLVLPEASAAEAALVEGVPVWRAGHLLDLVAALVSGSDQPLQRATPLPREAPDAQPDLRDIKGQAGAKRALEIAAAGEHSLLFVGPPGTGKSMLAQRLAGLLPPLDDEAALESAAVLSLAGHFDVSRWGMRVLRSPHHSASSVALVGGGSPPRPGEISLAQHGVLFLDELPEFQRSALEALREPMESGRIVISRAARQAEFPARFQLIAAMNPCPLRPPRQSAARLPLFPDQVARYQGRLSGPFLDRLDLQIEVPVIAPAALAAAADGETSAVVAGRVAAARSRALARQGCSNARLAAQSLDEHTLPEKAAMELLLKAAARLAWSGRSYHRVLRVARSIADLAASPSIGPAQMAEAIQLRRGLHPQLKDRVMSAEKYLNEADWKKFAKGKDYKDAALLKALAALDKAERAGAAPQLAALDEVTRQGQVLLKAGKGDKELAAYLDSLDKAVEKQRKLVEKLDEAERKAAKKEEEADDEDESPALLTVKMIPLLRVVPKGEVLHALIASAGKELAVLVARRPIAPSRRKLLISYLGASGTPKFFTGQCLFEEKAHTFVLDTAATGLAKKLKAALLKQTELRFKVRVRGTDPGDVDDDGEALDEGAEPATTEPSLAQQTGEARLAALAQAVENAARQRPADAAKLQALLAFARGKADAGQWAAAVQALDSIDTLLAAKPPAVAPATDPAPAFNARLAALIAQLKTAAAGNHPAVPALKLKLGEAGGRARTKDFAAAQALLDEAEALLAGSAGGSDDWPQARAAWRDALEAVDAQLDAVRGKMLASGDPDFRKIADLGLPALTRNHKTPVMAALMDIDRSAGEARVQAGERARQAVAAFRAHVRSDSKFRVLDEQSTAAFGVPLSLRQSLEAGLSGLDRAIARLT